MEYEIEDENRLFDPSTNPSLDHRTFHARVRETKRPARSVRKAFLIPDADEQPMQ